MRNLKKILALVLVFALSVSLFVTTAGAFTDDADIQNKEAVEGCSALNIINGFDDGSFKPADNVTRAQACKMICVADNGGVDPTYGTTETPTFSDINADWCKWAAPYIEACASRGIVSGLGNGAFGPAGNVTGSQFAKMLLVELGYNAVNQGYNGTSWEVNVNVDASNRGLYDGISIDPSQPLTRDNAAQMLWNALNAYEVEYKTDLIAVDGQLGTKVAVQDRTDTNYQKITLLEDKYDVIVVTGDLTDVTENSGKDTYSITIEEPMCNGEDYYEDGEPADFDNLTKDYSDLLYQNVRVLVKESKNGKDDVVFGVYATGKNTVQSGVLADLSVDGTNKVELNDVSYKLATGTNATTVYVNGNAVYDEDDNNVSIQEWVDANGEGNRTYQEGTSVELIANDGTTKYSILKVVTYEVAKVTYVGSDYITIAYRGGVDFDETRLSDDDYNYPSDIAKNDYVVISSEDNYSDGKGMVEQATIVEGKVTSTKSDDKVMIDGTWYTMATGVERPALNYTVMMVVVNGYVYYQDTATAGVENLALLVEGYPVNPGRTNTKYEARLIFTDGTDETVTIEKYWEDDSANGLIDVDVPQLVSYEVSKGVYTLTQVSAVRDNYGYDYFAQATSTVEVDGSVKGTISLYTDGSYDSSASKMYFESTGVVFVRYDADDEYSNSDASFKVVTGKVASAYDKTAVNAYALADESGNNLYAQVAVLDFGTGKMSGSDDNYMVALDASYRAKIDGTTYTMIQAWNGTESVLYKSEDNVTLDAGDIFQYSIEDAEEDLITIEKIPARYDAFVGAYDEDTGDITLYYDGTTPDTETYCYDSIDSKDTVIFYVDADEGAGIPDGEIRLADYYDGDDSDEAREKTNVRVYSEDDDYITILVVDVNNDYTAW